VVKNLNLEKAVDYLIDKTPEGAPFRDGTDPLGFSGKKYLDPPVGRHYFAERLIVRACRNGRWKASGKKPGSPEREHIPDIHFIGSVISSTGDLMAEPGPTSTSLSRHPSRKVAIWTDLRFSVPGGANQGKAAELSEPADPRSSAVRPNRPGRKKGSGGYDSKDAPLLEEIHALVENAKPVGLWVAALTVADRAPGKGSTENRAKRLVIKYKEKHDLR